MSADSQRHGRATDTVALLVVLGAILVFRLATLGSYPLMDTSEARYGEIARVMLETGNWITPQEIAGTPFWAKPPLYAWLSAASMELLGINELALRLPSLLCALGVLALCWGWARSLRPGLPVAQAQPGLLALATLATAPGFFAGAGAVMTDPTLALCTTAMLAAFHQVVLRGAQDRIWRYGFFVAAGLGMLAKGPVIAVYVGAPILIWSLWQRRSLAVWQALPWVRGAALTLLICVPWYALAEQRTPGFLKYFLLGEHVMRFLHPGWGGDLYGTAHAEPLGMIWLYLLGALGPAFLLLPLALLRLRRGAVAPDDQAGPARRFLALCALVPVFFFTFAGNIIWTYVLPALGPLAILLAEAGAPLLKRGARARLAVLAAPVAAGLVMVVAMLTWVPGHWSSHSSASLVAQWRAQAGAGPQEIVYLGRKAPASLRFYARGHVRPIADPDQALALIAARGGGCLAIAANEGAQVRARAAALPMAVVSLGANKDLELLRLSALAR